MAVVVPATIGESLYWSYASMAMAVASFRHGKPTYQQVDYIVRSKTYYGLLRGQLKPGSFFNNERGKIFSAASCVYCGSVDRLSLDHLIPRLRGGEDAADNQRVSAVEAETPRDKRQTPKVDGPLKPDGFRLNGIEVWGLAEDWQKVLTFVWGRRTNPPKWSDVATHLGVQDQMRDGDFAKLIYKINQKVKGSWGETLQTVKGLVVLRKPIRGAKDSPRSTAKTSSEKKQSWNTAHKSTSKAVGTPPPKRKTGARKK